MISNAGAKSLGAFLRECVEPGSVVVTNGFVSYPATIGKNYVHRPVDGDASGQWERGLLPGVHRVASLTKRWLMGTHQGAVREDHLQAYLDEFSSGSTDGSRNSAACCSGVCLSSLSR